MQTFQLKLTVKLMHTEQSIDGETARCNHTHLHLRVYVDNACVLLVLICTMCLRSLTSQYFKLMFSAH